MLYYHERMIAGATLTYWAGFHILVLGLLVAEGLLLRSRTGHTPVRRSVYWTLLLVLLALGFAAMLLVTRGRQPALEFAAGYLVESSLSIDNLFVFALLFRTFALREPEQRRALNWGVPGAVVLRGAAIVGGVTLLERFSAVEYVFGAVLLYASWRLVREKPEGRKQRPLVARVLNSGKGSPLIFAIIAVELTDLIFAVDSVPAVLAVTHDIFLAYTSNIFAILGLRSLFFVLGGLLERLRLLHYGLAAVLAFVAGKMLLTHWVTIPVGISLAVILVVLGTTTVVSLRPPASPPAEAG